MNNIFAILSFFCILPTPIKGFSQPVQFMFQVDEKPKKEILISLNSSFYRNAKEVVEGFKSKKAKDIYEKIYEMMHEDNPEKFPSLY